MENSINENIEIPQIVKDLTGVISLPEDFDFKEFISDYLWEKYNSLNPQPKNA